jgi:hypothetical protein
MLAVPAIALFLALPAAASARSAAPSARAPMTIVGMHVKSAHGAKVRVHVHKKAIWVRVTGRARRAVHLVVDGRRSARARRVPFLARVSGARMALGAHQIVVATARGVRLSRIKFAVVRRTPAIKVVIAPPVKSSSRTAHFAWKSAGKSSTAACRLDKGRFVACSSPRRYTGLKLGRHSFKLKVRTASGTTTLERGWVITKASTQTVTFLTRPASTTTSTEARFTWKASGPVTRTVCKLDSGNYLGCVQPYTVRNLKLGAHSFEVISWIYGRTVSARATWTVVKSGGSTPPPAAPAPPAPAGGGSATTSLGAPFAAGTTAANFQFGTSGCSPDAACVLRRRLMLRWVARHTGVLSTLHLQFKSSGTGSVNCPTGQNGYGGGTSGIAQISTYRVRADGAPDTTQLLARTQLTPCAAASGGSVGIPLGLATTRGQEFATVIQNIDAYPVTNYFSVNALYNFDTLVGANARNERSATAADSFYGLDPRELWGSSSDGGATWRLPEPGFVPTYVQVYADGYRDGQPFFYATCPCPGTLSGTQTMAFPKVPVPWTISQLGAFTAGPGSARVDLLVNDQVVASATLSGTGMLRAAIPPVTVAAGSTVKVRTTAGSGGLALVRIDADTSWKYGPVLTMGAGWRWQYIEQQGGGAADRAAVTVYPLPMYPTG